jgi:hypothetical protein
MIQYSNLKAYNQIWSPMGRYPMVDNTIFQTYQEALAFATTNSVAVVGSVITVTSDTDPKNNGVYQLIYTGEAPLSASTQPTGLKKIGSDIDLSNYVTRGEIASVYKAKGSVATYEDLPANAQVGDVYNVTATGKNYVWVENLVDGESGWDDLAGIIDLTPYATIESVNAHVETINGNIAANTAGIQALNTEVAKKVDAVEGSSLIPSDKLALIDANAGAIGSLNGQVSGLTGRVESLEQFFSDDSVEGGGISLAGVNAAIADLQQNKADKSALTELSGTVSTIQETLNAAVALNAEQTGYINSLQESVTELTNTYNSGIQGLTATVNSHTEAIGKNASDLSALTAIVNTINGDYLKAEDIKGKLDASVYEAKVAELVKADSDNLQAAKDYADEQAAAAAGAVNTDLLVEVARAKAAEEANAAAIAVEKGRLDAILTGEGVSEALDSFKELQAWIDEHEGGAADILAAASNAQKEVDALELVVAGIDEAYKAADASTLTAAKGYVDTELAKLGTAASKDVEFFATAEALAAVKATADAAAPQATTYTIDQVNTKIASDIAAAFEWVDVK